MRVYHYSDIKWSGEPRKSQPHCPNCDSPELTLLNTYLAEYTELYKAELYKDYECCKCKTKFTINWS